MDITRELTQPLDMPPIKRQRKGSKNYGQLTRKNYKPAVPMAIRTRGTPAGYYEIPVRQLIKLYINTSTGFWDTTQLSGAPNGTRGWRGIGMSFELDNTYVNLGEGSTSATITSAVPGFASLQGAFDLCKIADISIECWYTNQQDNNSTAGSYGGFDLYMVEDPNGVDCPANLADVMQYMNVKRMEGDSMKKHYFKIKPHVRQQIGGSADQDNSTSTTLSAVAPSCYLQTTKPAATHMGFRGWLDIPQSATARVSTLNILVTQTRRFKLSR